MSRHLARGVLGLLAVVAAVLGVSVVGPVALVLLVPAVVAWRGCPTCWTVGLMGTVACRRR